MAFDHIRHKYGIFIFGLFGIIDRTPDHLDRKLRLEKIEDILILIFRSEKVDFFRSRSGAQGFRPTFLPAVNILIGDSF